MHIKHRLAHPKIKISVIIQLYSNFGYFFGRRFIVCVSGLASDGETISSAKLPNKKFPTIEVTKVYSLIGRLRISITDSDNAFAANLA